WAAGAAARFMARDGHIIEPGGRVFKVGTAAKAGTAVHTGPTRGRVVADLRVENGHEGRWAVLGIAEDAAALALATVGACTAGATHDRVLGNPAVGDRERGAAVVNAAAAARAALAA